MKLAVVGLWHLGTVTSAVFAEAGHDVIAVDDPGAVAEIDAGRFPVLEDGLPELWASQRDAGRLRTGSLTDLADRDVAWICFDTPLDAEDRPDVGFVRARALAAIEHLKRGATVVVSSQLPVRSIAKLRSEAAATG